MSTRIYNVLSFAAILLCFYILIQYLFPAPCRHGVAYSIGTVDKKFGLSRDAFVAAAKSAERAWEDATKRDLFTYNESAPLAINLIYDSRQQKTDQAKTITNSLETASKNQAELKKKYDSAYAKYSAAQRAYDAHVESYNNDMRQLNADIKKYNSAGGASSEEYEQLQTRQQELSSRADALEEERKRLNVLAQNVNELAGAERAIVATYNEGVERIHNEFNMDREFEQGQYTGRAINIYEFTNAADLRLVLEHEMGHALGLSHLQNPSSVMHYKFLQGKHEPTGPNADDVAAVERQCQKTSFGIFTERLKGVLYMY